MAFLTMSLLGIAAFITLVVKTESNNLRLCGAIGGMIFLCCFATLFPEEQERMGGPTDEEIALISACEHAIMENSDWELQDNIEMFKAAQAAVNEAAPASMTSADKFEATKTCMQEMQRLALYGQVPAGLVQ